MSRSKRKWKPKAKEVKEMNKEMNDDDFPFDPTWLPRFSKWTECGKRNYRPGLSKVDKDEEWK